MEKFVNIKAICPYFEIQETVKEKYSVKRLEAILGMFKQRDKGRRRGRLSVNTIIANPELF